MPVETDNEQDDPVQMFLRAARGGDDDGGGIDQFTKAANGQRIGAAPVPVTTGATPSLLAPSPAINPDAAMGNGFREPMGPPAPPSDAALSLGQFADATGSEPTPPLTTPAPGDEQSQFPGALTASLAKPQLQKTHLEQVAPPPQAPTIDPAYAKAQEDLRAHSAVTPKYDPQTGKTLDQYKPSFGSRLGRAFLDAGEGFLHGGIRGAVAVPLAGAFGNKDAPGYYGRGAVNSQYFKDETARKNTVAADTAKIGSFEDQSKQAQQEFKDKNEIYKDTMGQAYKQDLNDIKQQGADEKAKQDKAMDDIRQQLADAKYPEAKLNAEIKARNNIADRLNLPKGYARDSYVATGKYPDNDTISQRLSLAEEKLGIMRDRNEIERARESSKKGAATFKDTAAIDKYSDQWYSKQRDQVRKEKGEALKNAGGDARKAQDDYAQIEASYKQRTGEFENRKKDWYDQVKGGKPITVKDSESGIPGTAGESGITQPIADVRTGQPIPGIEAHTNDGGAATAVAGGTDAKGRPTIAIQPNTQAAQPELTPIPDKSVKTAKGKLLNIGDDIPGHGKIKGFGKGPDGKINAMF